MRLALGNVALLVAERMYFQHLFGKALIVLQQLRQHVARRNLVGIVVLDMLEPADVADRLDRLATELPDALGATWVCMVIGLLRWRYTKESALVGAFNFVTLFLLLVSDL